MNKTTSNQPLFDSHRALSWAEGAIEECLPHHPLKNAREQISFRTDVLTFNNSSPSSEQLNVLEIKQLAQKFIAYFVRDIAPYLCEDYRHMSHWAIQVNPISRDDFKKLSEAVLGLFAQLKHSVSEMSQIPRGPNSTDDKINRSTKYGYASSYQVLHNPTTNEGQILFEFILHKVELAPTSVADLTALTATMDLTAEPSLQGEQKDH